MHRHVTALVTAGLAITLSAAAIAQTPRPDQSSPHGAAMKMSSGDSEFAHKAAMGGKHEVEGAKFAAGKASNAGVKTLANKLVSDHTAANNELMSLMKKMQHPMPADSKAEPEPWRSANGAAFDRAYVDHVITEHEKDIAMFEKEAKDGTDAELKAWAGKKLPTLREHLKMAQDLKAKL